MQPGNVPVDAPEIVCLPAHASDKEKLGARGPLLDRNRQLFIVLGGAKVFQPACTEMAPRSSLRRPSTPHRVVTIDLSGLLVST